MEYINHLSGSIVDAAIKVHKSLGPGLLESADQACLQYELQKRQLNVLSQVALPVFYDGLEIEVGYRLDLLIENQVIVELKAVDRLHKIHEAQLLSYLNSVEESSAY